VGKIARKKQSEGVRFVNSALKNTVPCCEKYTLTDCFFGDFFRFLNFLHLQTLKKESQNNVLLITWLVQHNYHYCVISFIIYYLAFCLVRGVGEQNSNYLLKKTKVKGIFALLRRCST